MKTATIALFLLGTAALPAQDTDFGVAVATTLTQIQAEPQAYRSVKVTFTMQFASLGRITNPFFTKFTPTDFANFYGWADEQPIWREQAYQDLFGTIFLSKSNDQLEELYNLSTYDRIRVTGVIRDTFQGAPWIEVLSFAKQPTQLDTALLTHLYRGEKLMDQRLWQRAIAELAFVPGASVPAPALKAAYKSLGVCLLRVGEAKTAATYLASAASLDGKDGEIRSLLAIARDQPDQAIDRTVDARTLKDHERPMWEAFEQQGQQPTR
jgi:hypothetical protein